MDCLTRQPFQRSRLRHCHQSLIIVTAAEQHRRRRRHRPSPVQAEHLSFSFVIGFFFVYKIIFFSFLPSMQLKHVTLVITADIVHFLAMCKPAM